MSEMITRSIIVKADASEAYRVWKNFENFPMFMKDIQSVKNTGDRTSHWTVKGPLGVSVEWDAETTRLDENKRIAWNTKDHVGDLTTSGQVTFNSLPAGETEVTVVLQYDPRAGMTGDAVTKLLGNPEERVEEDLRSFKNYIEGRYERTASE